MSRAFQDNRFVTRLLDRLGWRGLGALSLSLVGLLLVILGVLALSQRSSSPSYQLRISSGTDVEVREKMVQFLTQKGAQQGLTLEDAYSEGSLDALKKVERGELDLALVQGGIHLDAGSSVREVAAIDLECLHLLVRTEQFEAVSSSLKNLGGKTVFLNYARSGTNLLARLLLARIGLKVLEAKDEAQPDSVAVSKLRRQEIMAMLEEMHTASAARRQELRRQLPDACFLVASLPSTMAWHLVREADYRLVPLPFAEAFAMSTIEEVEADSDRIDQLHIQPATIPEYTYSISPAVPPAACPTLGVRTLLVANEKVPAEAILKLMPLIYEGDLPTVYRPPRLAEVIPEYPLHPGTVTYRDRNKPLVRSDVMEAIRGIFGFLGPLIGAGLALYGYYKWRQLLRFTKYFRQVIHLDLVAKGLKEDKNLPEDRGERAQYLEKKLTSLQKQAVTDFCDNYFRGEAIVHNLLALLAETGQIIRAMDRPAQESTPSTPSQPAAEL
ncbi:MAG: TAXI family TRAP transporter solute-binding subunit [Gemmataceae bacterium]